MRDDIRLLLGIGVIQVGQSDITSPVIFVQILGKNTRLGANNINLNTKNRTEFFSRSNIEEVIEKMSSVTFIIVMD